MNKKKRLLSIALVIAMTVSAFSGMTAMADSSGGGASSGTITDATPTPTVAPTTAATTAPTVAPTAAATTAPTAAPTAAATTAPTAAPTAAATTAPTAEPTTAPTAAPIIGDLNKNNSVSISESFDADVANGDNYVWDVAPVADWGGSNKGISLTAEAAKTILSFENGIGGNQKDVKISFKAGTVKGFEQTAAVWDLVFKSTSGTELFKIEFTSGGNWVRSAALVADGKTQVANYTHTDKAYTDMSAYLSFGADSNTVTFGNVSAKIADGQDIGSISVEYNNVKDWDRPFILDDFKVETVDKQKVTFKITSDNAEESVAGTELTIGDDVYVTDDKGIVEAYYLNGDYTYEVKLAKHSAVSNEFKVVNSGKEITTTTGTTTTKTKAFVDIDSSVSEGKLIKAFYNDETGELEKIEVDTVQIENGKYVVDEDVNTTTSTETTIVPLLELTEDDQTEEVPDKYMLWESLESTKPLGKWSEDEVTATLAPTTTEKELTNDIDIVLEYVGDPYPANIELDGGSEYIYLPVGEATSSTKAFTATVYDNADLVMEDVTVEWSLPGQGEGISVDNGVVTITSAYPLTDDNGVDVIVRATVNYTDKDGNPQSVVKDTQFHIHNTARATTWDITGPAVVKDGKSATYAAENIKDQYGNEYDGEVELVLTSSDEKAVIDGLTITPNVGTSRTEEITITTTLAGSETKVDRQVTVYGYDFYEPGVGTASYGEPRMEDVKGVKSIVWPVAGSSTTITLPEPVLLEAGSAKMITFDNAWVVKTIGAQERSIRFINSDGTDVINIDFSYSNVVKDWSIVDKTYTGTQIGALNGEGEVSSAIFVLKTDASGITSAILSYNGNTLDEYIVSEEPLTDIASIVLTSGKGVPAERMMTLTNILISDSDVAEVEIIGDSTIAKISGITASKKMKGSIFSQAEGETFTWSVADAEGNAIDGVTIDQDGVLSVTDTVAADTVAVVSYTSSLSTEDAPKLATHEITIKDFASVKSFDIVGPVAVNAGETVTYSVENVVDEYGDSVTMPVSYAITAGDDIASVDAKTGVVTTTGKLGKYTVSVTVGNPEKTSVKTIEAEVAKYAETGEGSGSVEVDVTKLANYSADTAYLVTTATADGVLVKQTETKSTDGKITVDMTGAAKYEVSPIYSYASVGNVASGKEIPLCDGLYDFTFKKSNSSRGDIFVNGYMVGNNVDQYGKGRNSIGSYYTAKDVNVQGGKAIVSMGDGDTNLDTIVIKKAPTILPRKTHVYILGDSLVSAYYGTFADADGDGIPTAGDAQTGWGQVMDKFISTDLNVTNLAQSGSTAIAQYGTAFPGAIANAKTGDYILMETGYNDKNYSSEKEMAETLQKIADECKAKGVILILSTPNFGTGHGTTNKENVQFGPKLLEVAAENDVLGINLSKLGYDKYVASGKSSDYWAHNFNVYYDNAQQDGLHLSYFGAMNNASIVAQAIYDAQHDESNPELAAQLANLKINTEAYNMIDTEGETVTLQVVEKTASAE